jgi:hypothetical protein
MERYGKAAALALFAWIFVLAAKPSAGDIIKIDPQALPFTKRVGTQVLSIPTTGTIRPLAHYTQPGFDAGWDISTAPLEFRPVDSLKELPDGRTILDVVKQQFAPGGWTFATANDVRIADDSFLIHTYEALAPAPPAENTDAWTLLAKDDPRRNDVEALCVQMNNCVGSELYFTYNPTGNDPTQNVHWIQVLETSDKGVFVDVVARNPTPFYDVGGTAGSRGFFDDPSRNNPATPYLWFGSILLVTSPAPQPGNPFPPGLVTVYGELDWGWGNQSTPPFPVPEPASFALLIPGLLALAACRGVKKSR